MIRTDFLGFELKVGDEVIAMATGYGTGHLVVGRVENLDRKDGRITVRIYGSNTCISPRRSGVFKCQATLLEKIKGHLPEGALNDD